MVTKTQWLDIISQRSNSQMKSACLPYILALGEMKFDLCEILFDEFLSGESNHPAYTTLSETEMDIVLKRAQPFGIPLLNSKYSEQDQQKLTEYKLFEGQLLGFADAQNEHDLGILKLLFMFPQFSLHLLRQRLAAEYNQM